MRALSIGWTPSDAGLIVNLEQGDRFLLSVVINGKEYFVSNYNRYTRPDDIFNYEDGLYLKLLPQAPDATEPSAMSIWSAGAPLDRGKYNLDGITYTIWNDGKTLKMANDFQFLGALTNNYNDDKACDVVFIIPTVRGKPTVDKRTLSSFDPNGTLGRGTDPFDGAIGTGFLGMTYREVYMFDVPRKNNPISYTNASLVTFNTTQETKSWSNGQITCKKGHAAYAFADEKHDKTTRTIFRLYLLDEPFVNCPSTYFFATDEQDVKSYRKVSDPKTPKVASEWTTAKKIYTMDYLTPMTAVNKATSPIYKTDYMNVPTPDSTYYYVGKSNTYVNGGGAVRLDPTDKAVSQFKNIDSLRIYALKDQTYTEDEVSKPFIAPANAYGRMVVDTTSTEQNLGVAFEPVGYFLKVLKPNGFTNVRMTKTSDPNVWITQDMWTLDEDWLELSIKATLMTGPEFSEEDPGLDVDGWSAYVTGSEVDLSTGGKVTTGATGYACITINNASANGNLTFYAADVTRTIHYDNNTFLGVEIPDQHPLSGQTTVRVTEPRLKAGYIFDGWNTQADGKGTTYLPGATYDFGESTGTVTLYAQAHYNGTLHVAISFVDSTAGKPGKRYFLTHPGTATPRYARARTFDSWENTLQGMENAENADPNYVSTYEVRCPVAEIKKKDGDIPDLTLKEHVLAPRQYTMHGYEDSLVFYENFKPNDDEYLGLYYTTPNTMLANNTWAGLFTTTSKETNISWPTYQKPYISGVRLKSERYVEEYDHEHKPDSLILKVRSNSGEPWVKYDPLTDQFDGVATEGAATTFDISAVSVADAHYIILPDTAYDWNDTITFGYHNGEQIREEVWSSLIGKQLMAVMRLGEDTVYFHPNRNKVINDPNNLYLSKDFRVSMVFDLIHDSRVSAPLEEGDSVMHETTDYHWHNDIVSGMNSPINVKNGSGQYIDVVDTFRITISHDAISKIKEYRGRWNKNATGLKLDNASGSVRHRDIIIRTKTYHERAEEPRLILQPEQESYSFSPLAGVEKQIDFLLIKETYHSLLDKDDNLITTVVTARDTIKNTLLLKADMCSLKGSTFDKVDGKTTGDHVTLATHADNTTGINYDTLTVTIPSITVGGTPYTDVTAKVPLTQAALTASELVWSVKDGGKRYFIMAVKEGSSAATLKFREFTHVGSKLYKLGEKTELVKGSNEGDNSDEKYITPWTFAYKDGDKSQLTLQTQYRINEFFTISGETGALGGSASSYLTYSLVEVHTNANSNYEEKVRLQYGPGQWLKFNGGATPSITLVTKEEEATIFSWSYMLQEYSLLNNGTYPSTDRVEFAYNITAPKTIQTRYMAQREYSMLLDNELTYLCHEDETNIANLTAGAKDWKTYYTITHKTDSRTFADGASTTSSGFGITTNATTLTHTVTPASATSPTNVKIGDKYVNIVDTLVFTLNDTCHYNYRFKEDWSGFKSISDANLKIPLVRKTYHTGTFSTLTCAVKGDNPTYTFPAAGTGKTQQFVLRTTLHEGTQALDIDDNVAAVTSEKYIDVTTSREDTVGMQLNEKTLAEVRLIDIYGNKPDWCEIAEITANTVTVRCKEDGILSPRTAYLYLAYIIQLGSSTRFVNYRITVMQASRFEYANNQQLRHTVGASGDPVDEHGRQQVHENKRILYYYPQQEIELPVRERAFYGWWRWYREGYDEDSTYVADADVPDTLWRVAPRNAGRWNYPFRIIGDSVMLKKKTDGTDSVKVLVTMGRWTVFHYKSKDYNNKQDPPAKNPRVASPVTIRAAGPDRGTYPVMTYAADISNYYDNLPMSLKDKNQVDAAMMDTMPEIIEPTLSLREVFELHPWTEMAEKMENYKSEIPKDAKSLDDKEYELAKEKYLEDHVMMAPTGAKLLLRTEQRYDYHHLSSHGHAESMLGYYMRDDKWDEMSDVRDEDGWSRKDTMIWCGGWDADCLWYTYDPKTQKYTPCTHPVTEEEDFLEVPAKGAGANDTVYYCLRARSWRTELDKAGKDSTVDGDYFFNICRYKICYHHPNIYGPKKEVKTKKETRALITNEEIEQRYDVLERLDFDYVQPGSGYSIYPHPLPWADASYGYTYPETSSLPHNRYHDQSDFPNHGEYGLINKIPYGQYWYTMDQHGGAANGYMIYCDGMASAGQVAALTLNTHLCAGQKMFFSGYVGNPSNQTNKSNPNFIFSVQGSTDGTNWDDITSYMTGDIQPRSKDNKSPEIWHQIFFPILHNEGGKDYTHFRVRIYNVAANFDGNDFVIDDMCIFATKQPLIAYQAQTTCQDYGHSEEDTHVLLRVDYQGITGEGYNGDSVCYTVQQITPAGVESYVRMTDHYLKEDSTGAAATDTLYGKIYIPEKTYIPQNKDSVYRNMNDFLTRFDTTYANHLEHPGDPKYPIVREGYIYEILEGDIRPVKYIMHRARMDSRNDYQVHISAVPGELLSSICGMTSHLKVSNRMVLELNGEEQPESERLNLCSNATYDISLRVKGSMYLDSVAPIDVNGSCVNDWLVFGDTARVSSRNRYGYYYSDIRKVVSSILRAESTVARDNKNQKVTNLAAVDRDEMTAVQSHYGITLDTTAHPYDILADLVNNGYLLLYKSKLTASVSMGDSLQYVIFPIVGTGSQELTEARVEVCPNPILVKLKPDKGGGAPLAVGGLNRDSAELALPITVLAEAEMANTRFKLRVDSIRNLVGIYSITLRSTDDPEYREGLHHLELIPDLSYPAEDYYEKGDSIVLTPAPSNNYQMRPGYNYTFDILMQTWTGSLTDEYGCEVGSVPFTMSIQPKYVRWNPQSSSNNNWNDASNWIGIDAHNNPLHEEAHYVPMEHTSVLIPAPTEGKPYPQVQPLPTTHPDSIQKVNFQYNRCDTIRFLPGAAIGQQQRIAYTGAVVDLPIQKQKWALRGAPIKGMLSGDLYMANADRNNETPLWEVGEFDMNGRSYTYGNATFWLSVYARDTKLINKDEDSTRTAAADWSKVTNGMTLPLLPANGFAVYARPKTGLGDSAIVRLPKHDDEYYYYGTYGERLDYKKESDLQATRTSLAGGEGKAGKLAFHAESEDYTIANDNSISTNSFVFGNPSMGYVDIWGFIDDNCLKEEFDYLDAAGNHQKVSRASAMATTDRISELTRYLPPMHAIVVKLRNEENSTSLNVRLNADRIVTETSQVIPSVRACPASGGDQALAHAPQRQETSRGRGIMTVTALNPVSPRCNSRLLLGQGYHNTVLDGEDAVLTTFNIDNFHMTNTPTTPFNIYAVEGQNALSIDLRNDIVNVPISFYMSALPYDPTTQLWFTGVNSVDGPLVLYDALTDTERTIIDGICLTIETPTQNHERRYYIRRPGYTPDEQGTPTDEPTIYDTYHDEEHAVKIIRNDQVLILRGGHVYTVFGQKLQ